MVVDSGIQPADHVLLVCELHHQPGALAGLTAVEVVQCGVQKGHGLGVGPGPRGLGGRLLRVARGPRGVAGGHRVVAEYGGIPGFNPFQRVEQPGVQPRRPARGDRALHGEPGQFVAVDQTAPIPQQQPSLVQPPQGGQVDAQRRQQSVVQPVRSRGRDLQHLEVGRGDAGGARQHRIPHGGGQGSVRLLGDLGDEERVAARHRVHRLGLQRSVGQQFGHAGHAQRSQPKRAEVLDRREVTEQRTGRVLSGDLVIAIGDDDGARHGLQSADQEPQHLDRCRVDPVQILDHQHRGLGAQGVVGRLAHLDERSVPIQRSEISQEIAERAERPRRGQRVTGAAEHPQPGRLGAGHLDQRGLARPRLATDRQSDAGAPEGAVQSPGQRVQLRVPLDEPHGLTVERSHQPWVVKRLRDE